MSAMMMALRTAAAHQLRPHVVVVGRVAARALSSEAQSVVGRKRAASSSSSSGAARPSVAAAVAAAGLAGAALAASTCHLEEAKSSKSKEAKSWPHKRPTQKYESPRPMSTPTHPDYADPPPRPDLPTITLEQLSEHNDEDDMWFSFRGAVYDMSAFKYGHPGGTPRLLMAAGQDLEPYWEVYRQHFRGHILQWMEKHRVANLSPSDAKAAADFEFGDMYESDPVRDPNLLGCTMKPWNGEPRLDLLTKDYITPNELFYTRCHLAVPDIDPSEYVLVVKGRGIKKHKFTLEDLKTMFPKHEVTTTLQCAGNRREDMHGDRKLFLAPHWVVGAMSCAKWGGVKMRDVLRHCGMEVDAMSLGEKEYGDQLHLQFLGYDTDETGFCYGSGIPMDKAVDALGDSIFAFEMNDQPLPRDHGYPVRAIVPGNTGNCQCKWLRKVIVSDHESKKPWQQKSYRGFAPDISFEEHLSSWPPPRLDQAPIVYEMPVQSLVCNPPQNSMLGMKGATDVEVKGVAWSGGGRKIARVDVSIDGGKTWTASELYKPIEQRRNRHWAWTHFSKKVPLPEDVRKKIANGESVKLDITSKAMNSDFNVQPETMEPYWNARGVCINHWYHVKTTLDPNRAKGEVETEGAAEYEFGNTPSGGVFKAPWDAHGWTSDPKHRSDPKAKLAPESKHF